MIVPRTVLCLGLSQLVAWGISYYLIGVFGELIAADLGWSDDLVYGGFSLALLVMGLISPLAGRLVDRHGGRRVMLAGALVNAAGCALLAVAHGPIGYYAAWICLGVAMRLTLYDAAFAALARIGGPSARRPIAQITLLGGLASTVFWPIGHLLAEALGWRGAVVAYGAIALLTMPLYLAIPDDRHESAAPDEARLGEQPRAVARRDILLAGTLYALIATLVNFLNAGMSAHMIAILAGLGIASSAAVWIATLRGIGQSSARLCEVLFGRRIDPLTLNLATTALLPFSFLAGLFSGQVAGAALTFAFVYGAANGIATITRGTTALVLFDHRTYGAFVGRLIAPSFILSAAAPVTYAFVIGRFGEAGALILSVGLAAIAFAAALGLKARFG